MRTFSHHDACALLSDRHGEPARVVLTVLATALSEDRVVSLLLGGARDCIGLPLADLVGPSHVPALRRALDRAQTLRQPPKTPRAHRRLCEIRKNVAATAR